eukprot:gnl/TRDRNA2_/TRDRNA2_178791_c0_seq1.p1 gnl/TRDRNA2_/TRDRNA2_178791_c0~~gnl/TRDRNA2_/TRDRNA2_178791_c0_seq1.p1  ORF type:complete len:361 (-),score=106.51 gnl/TRDRNA2_/TRDRNA2_178791_c0_seq1:31-1113(-)
MPVLLFLALTLALRGESACEVTGGDCSDDEVALLQLRGADKEKAAGGRPLNPAQAYAMYKAEAAAAPQQRELKAQIAHENAVAAQAQVQAMMQAQQELQQQQAEEERSRKARGWQRQVSAAHAAYEAAHPVQTGEALVQTQASQTPDQALVQTQAQSGSMLMGGVSHEELARVLGKKYHKELKEIAGQIEQALDEGGHIRFHDGLDQTENLVNGWIKKVSHEFLQRKKDAPSQEEKDFLDEGLHLVRAFKKDISEILELVRGELPQRGAEEWRLLEQLETKLSKDGAALASASTSGSEDDLPPPPPPPMAEFPMPPPQLQASVGSVSLQQSPSILLESDHSRSVDNDQAEAVDGAEDGED